MSSIRTQFTHKSIMLGILFLGILLNSKYEEWSSSDAVADQDVIPASEIQTEQIPDDDLPGIEEEEAEVGMASFG